MLDTNIKIDKKWIYSSVKSPDIIEQILLNRNIPKNDWVKFLNPDFIEGLHDPYLLDGMTEAVMRIKDAIKAKETVGIFADYDADGIPASVLLSEALERYGLKTHVYIPTRYEGYGLNKKGIDELKEKGCTILFTVDLGIREIKNTEYAKSLGIDVIITDHHEPGDTIPDALAVINPKRKNSKYPFRELSGGGVVFKLIQALSLDLKEISEGDLKWMLDLVAITTICDCVPLLDENRIFAKFGLIVLSKTRRLGLKKLYQIMDIDASIISTYTVGFQIGPRINAPGRLNQKQESFELLRSADEKIALSLATDLNKINLQRQLDLERMLIEAKLMVSKSQLDQRKVICLWHKDWPSGLIGLIAGKLTEEFSRPCIIFEQGETKSKGSARSIDNFNMVEVLEQEKELLISFGGHAKAAGLTIENENLEIFYNQLLEIASTKLTDDDLVPKIKIDMKLKQKDLTFDLLKKIQKLEPFGLGNPRPVLSLEQVIASDVKMIGKSKNHLKFKLGNVDVIGFGLGFLSEEIIDKKIDIAFNLDENIWNNNRTLQIKIIDIKLSEIGN